MNTLLFQMIASRAATGGTPSIAEALNKLRGNGNATLDPQQLLAKLSGSNPKLNALAKRLEELKASAAARENLSVIDVPVPANQPAMESASALAVPDSTIGAADLDERTSALEIELKVLRERNDLLAQALGACCVCWGQNLECRNCRGRGGPGFSMPDESLVNEYVVPAIRTLRSRRAGLKNFSQHGEGRSSEGVSQETASH